MELFVFTSLAALGAAGCLVALSAHILWKALYEVAKLPASGWLWSSLVWLTRGLGALLVLSTLVTVLLLLLNQPGMPTGDVGSGFVPPPTPPEWDRD